MNSCSSAVYCQVLTSVLSFCSTEKKMKSVQSSCAPSAGPAPSSCLISTPTVICLIVVHTGLGLTLQVACHFYVCFELQRRSGCFHGALCWGRRWRKPASWGKAGPLQVSGHPGRGSWWRAPLRWLNSLCLEFTPCLFPLPVGSLMIVVAPSVPIMPMPDSTSSLLLCASCCICPLNYKSTNMRIWWYEASP